MILAPNSYLTAGQNTEQKDSFHLGELMILP